MIRITILILCRTFSVWGKLLLLTLACSSATATTFTWIKLASGNASGSWTNQSNWVGGTLPATTSDTANCNALDLAVDSTITLDGSQSINTLNFGDTNTATAASWIINAGSPSSSTLTLGGAGPAISVTSLGSGEAAVINAVVTGTAGFTKAGTSFLQLNGANTYSGGTVVSGTDCRISVGNDRAFGTGTVTVGGSVGDGQIWFNAAGARTLTNAFEIRTIRWIIDNNTVNGVAAGNLAVGGNVLFNTGASNVRDIYCNMNLTLNGNVSVTPASNPMNKQGGYLLTLNGTNTVGGASAVNAGTLVVNGPMNGGATFTVNSGGTLGGTGVFSGAIVVANNGTLVVGSSSGGTLTCGGLTANATSRLNFALGATNNPANSRCVVNGNLTLAGTWTLSDLGSLGAGAYTNFYYSGTLANNGVTINGAPAGSSAVLDTSVPHYVQVRLLAGQISPAAGDAVPMDSVNPLTLSWIEVAGAAGYDIYLGTVSNTVAVATTNTAGVYLGRTSALTLNTSSLQPGTTYYWRVDGVAVDGTLSPGTVRSFSTGASMVDLMQDTWAATDALNRSLPGIAECGSPRTNQPIGIFYFLWHTTNGLGTDGPRDNTQEILRLGGYADPHNPWASNPLWMSGANARSWYWSQPQNGYYSGDDEWVIRRHIALLEAAGVDVLGFDSTNGHPETQAPTFLKIMAVIRKMRLEGTPVHLRTFFYTHATSPATVNWLYTNFYQPGLYRDLWFLWQGKPLIIGYPDATVPAEVLNFFTWRTGWANASNLPTNEWQWVDTPTRQDFGFNTRGDLAEQLPVACGGWANGNLGRSFSNGSQSSYDKFHLTTGRTERLGIQFSEQAFQGLKVDPQFLWVVGWNEWWAGAWTASSTCYTHLLADCCNTGNRYFVDNYNAEYSRDIEPVTGSFTDNYYYQLVSYARQRKGVRPVPPASAPTTINLAGNFTDWAAVGPEFRDVPGDTLPRNWPSTFGNLPNYTNNSGRNDFTLMKVARDSSNLYFFAQCSSNLTSYSGSNWMVLFLDTDCNHTTGWEGYDYVINLGPRTASATSLSRNTTVTNGWSWATLRSDLAYTVSGNQIMLSIPRATLGLGADPIKLDFHWADNFQTNDIADFGADGDSAPDRRFNYRYVTTTNSEVVLLSDDFESGKQAIWDPTWTNGSRWDLTSASPFSGSYCAMGSYAAAGQSNLIARVSTLGYGSFRLNFHYKLTNVLNAQTLQLSYLATNGWVPIRQLSRDEFYPVGQAWTYDERQNLWLNFTDTRFNSGPDARFFSTNFAFRIDAGALTAAGQRVFVDAVTLTANTQIPAPVITNSWRTQDIGNAGNTGFVATNGATFTVSGSGLDIWNSGDAFRFLYLTRSGDGQFSARVTGITPTDPWAKAGVMIRESLDPGARHALMTLTCSNGVAFQQRVLPLGDSAMTVLGPSVAPPYWVRIARSGNAFTGYVSTNGVSWTQVGTVSIPGFSSTALWGLAVTAHSNTLTNVATFDQVAFGGSPPAFPPILNQTLIAGQTLTVTNAASDPDAPPEILTFSALTAPTNATVSPSTGLFTWRPTIDQSPLVTRVQLKVEDNGVPSQSATQSFWVTVNRPIPPQLAGAASTDNAFGLSVFGDSGPDYTIQGTTNLGQPGAWVTLLTTNSPTLPFWWADSQTNLPQRFYRVLLGP
jgi:autotransporter-associated beta strand protein